MRTYEMDELQKLGELTLIERRDTPVTRLADLATLVPGVRSSVCS
jgi:hypothetical protein